MNWYMSLNIDQKINLKTLFPEILGTEFSSLGCLFSFQERIQMAYNKLKMEGFNIQERT